MDIALWDLFGKVCGLLDGSFRIPLGPGLGVEVDPDKLRGFCDRPVEFR